MEKVSNYRSVLKSVLSELADLANKTPQDGAETLCVFDDSADCYVLLNAGWSGNHRLRGNTIFARIKSGKIWIEEDWTEEGIANELTRRGVPPTDIVLGFHPPKLRPQTQFAVA